MTLQNRFVDAYFCLEDDELSFVLHGVVLQVLSAPSCDQSIGSISSRILLSLAKMPSKPEFREPGEPGLPISEVFGGKSFDKSSEY